MRIDGYVGVISPKSKISMAGFEHRKRKIRPCLFQFRLCHGSVFSPVRADSLARLANFASRFQFGSLRGDGFVMEWLDGVSVRDVAWSEARVSDRTKIADILLRTFLEQMLQDGVFHADPHPGNVMLLADGRLALIDFGAAGRLDAVQQAALRELMAGVSRRDADAVAQAVLQVASLRHGVDIASAPELVRIGV